MRIRDSRISLLIVIKEVQALELIVYLMVFSLSLHPFK